MPRYPYARLGSLDCSVGPTEHIHMPRRRRSLIFLIYEPCAELRRAQNQIFEIGQMTRYFGSMSPTHMMRITPASGAGVSLILIMYSPITQFAHTVGEAHLSISEVSPVRRSNIVHASPNELMISNTRVVHSISGLFDQSLTL